MKRSFFQAAVVSILLYGCTTWTLTKRLEKKIDGNYTKMLRAILNKSWRQHPTRLQLYGHIPPITKTIQVRSTSLMSSSLLLQQCPACLVRLWTPSYGRTKTWRTARTYILQLCEDTGCRPEDLPEAMSDREEWRKRVRDICASGTTWWYVEYCGLSFVSEIFENYSGLDLILIFYCHITITSFVLCCHFGVFCVHIFQVAQLLTCILWNLIMATVLYLLSYKAGLDHPTSCTSGGLIQYRSLTGITSPGQK